MSIFGDNYLNYKANATNTVGVYSFINANTISTYLAKYNQSVTDNDVCGAAAWYNVITSGGVLTQEYFDVNSAKVTDLGSVINFGALNCIESSDKATSLLVQILKSTDFTKTEFAKRSVTCSAGHMAAESDCANLIARVDGAGTSITVGQYRDLNYGSCFISWSCNASFTWEDL